MLEAERAAPARDSETTALFERLVDESRNATRRWCRMALCGNRAKAARHYRSRGRAAAARS